MRHERPGYGGSYRRVASAAPRTGTEDKRAPAIDPVERATHAGSNFPLAARSGWRRRGAASRNPRPGLGIRPPPSVPRCRRGRAGPARIPLGQRARAGCGVGQVVQRHGVRDALDQATRRSRRSSFTSIHTSPRRSGTVRWRQKDRAALSDPIEPPCAADNPKSLDFARDAYFAATLSLLSASAQAAATSRFGSPVLPGIVAQPPFPM